MKRNPQDKLDRLHKQYMKGQIGRRDFLKLLGVAGPASGLALALPSAAAGAPAGLSEDEMVILSHLPDQQIGKKYPKGRRLTSVSSARCQDLMPGGDFPDLPEIISGLMPSIRPVVFSSVAKDIR
jgi:hypothetical protein